MPIDSDGRRYLWFLGVSSGDDYRAVVAPGLRRRVSNQQNNAFLEREQGQGKGRGWGKGFLVGKDGDDGWPNGNHGAQRELSKISVRSV